MIFGYNDLLHWSVDLGAADTLDQRRDFLSQTSSGIVCEILQLTVHDFLPVVCRKNLDVHHSLICTEKNTSFRIVKV